MNPLTTHTAQTALAQQTFTGTLSGLITAVFLVMFAGWVFWAYRPAHRQLMEDLGKLPLQDDTDGGAA
jgi:cytochrome c oxidase cbb3-type subunit 4